MLRFIGIARMPLGLLAILAFVLYSLIGERFFSQVKEKRKFYSKTTSFFCKILLSVLGIRLQIKGLENILNFHQGLILCNHLSYIDILILSSVKPSIFITSEEVRRNFFLGTLSTLGGSLFVERRSRAGIIQEIQKIAKVIQQEFSVTLFPEGTTGNGEKLLPFKKSLIDSAIQAKAPVLPVCIRYQEVNGKNIDAENRDRIYYYGEMTFFSHFWKFFFAGPISVSIEYFSPIPYSPERGRKDISQLAYHEISENYFQ